MRTGALIVASIVAGSLVTACAHRGGIPAEMSRAAEVRPLTQTLSVDFTSGVPNDYWVLSGPAQTYQKLEVNQQVRSALERYAQRKSGAAGGQALVLDVRVDRFWTGFRAIGALADTNIPEEIQKSATIELSAELRRGDQSLGRRQVEKSVTDVERADSSPFYPNYDFGPVLQQAVRLALEDVDGFVNQAAGSRG